MPGQRPCYRTAESVLSDGCHNSRLTSLRINGLKLSAATPSLMIAWGPLRGFQMPYPFAALDPALSTQQAQEIIGMRGIKRCVFAIECTLPNKILQ